MPTGGPQGIRILIVGDSREDSIEDVGLEGREIAFAAAAGALAAWGKHVFAKGVRDTCSRKAVRMPHTDLAAWPLSMLPRASTSLAPALRIHLLLPSRPAEISRRRGVEISATCSESGHRGRT